MANKIEAVIETGIKIFRFFAAASLANSRLAGIDNKPISIQKIVPCICLSSIGEVESEPSNQPSKITMATKKVDINIPKNNLFFSIFLIAWN